MQGHFYILHNIQEKIDMYKYISHNIPGIMYLDFAQHARENKDFAQHARENKDFAQHAREHTDFT